VTVAARRRLALALDVAVLAVLLGMTACARLSPPSPGAEREEGNRLY
jgi:hypothetical protein